MFGDLIELNADRYRTSKRMNVDSVIQAVSTNAHAGILVLLDAIDEIRRELEGVNIISGLSNVSFGLPSRSLVNRGFLTLAMKSGLNAAILDPSDKKFMSALAAARVLLNQDPWCQAYTRAFREGRLKS